MNLSVFLLSLVCHVKFERLVYMHDIVPKY